STVEALYSSDPGFDFTRNLFDKIHKNAKAIIDPEHYDISPLTPLSESPSPQAATSSWPKSPSQHTLDSFPATPLAKGSAPAHHSTLLQDRGSSCDTTLNIPTGTDQPPLPPPLPTQAPAVIRDDSATSAEPLSRLAKRKAADKARSKENAKKKKNAHSSYPSNTTLENKHLKSAEPTNSSYTAKSFPITKMGFPSVRAKKRSSVYYLEDLVGPKSKFNFGLRRLSDKPAAPIIDGEGRVVGVYAGVPKNDETWDDVHHRAASLLEDARGHLTFEKKETNGRRGKFPAINVGISHGGGQPHPKVLQQADGNKKVLEELVHDRAFERISGFATGAFSTWAPRLYQYQNDCLSQLIEKDQQLRREGKHPSPGDEELRRNWPKTPWAAAAFNFGPQTVCYPHADYGNLAFGWCCITALGDYDYTKGGHLVLWDFKLVLEFPPGATILIPSSAIHHSNTRIFRGEKRYSFTQYSSGGLFRWVHNDFMTAEKYRSAMPEDELPSALDELARQLEFGLSLYSTVDEIKKVRNISIVEGDTK
ncbi:hypothetical protein CVT26_012726, partial [Gymnopilus dilepis]